MDAPVLELRGVSVKGRQQPRLDQVQLRLHAGERLALLGPSGAGKSTLLAVANGLLQADQGQVLWGGEALSRRPRNKRRQQRQIGTLWQDLRLIEELSVQQNLNCGRLAQWGWPKALLNLLLPLETEACAAALRQLDLDPALLAQSVGQLSGGQRQRVAIARLLRQNPLLWLADEPLSSLDPRLAGELLQLLLEQTAAPRALVMSLHRPDLLAGFSRVVGLREGRILFDCTPEQLEPQALQGLYAESTTP
ncbi:MAG: ATP-binding cassette domain-containing protein [Synechococcus sp. WH 8007]|nr:ATP-binding cassette domain-containing protein [Synechococcus sp. WH 8007]